jgi:hypothetical protein
MNRFIEQEGYVCRWTRNGRRIPHGEPPPKEGRKDGSVMEERRKPRVVAGLLRQIAFAKKKAAEESRLFVSSSG